MKVKIISGTYGRKVRGALDPVGMGSICEVDDKEAERIIALGIAEAVAETPSKDCSGSFDFQAVEHPPEEEKAADGYSVSSEGTPESDEVIEIVRDGNRYSFTRESLGQMPYNDIKALAKDCGMEKPGQYKSKDALIDAFVAFSLELEEDPAISLEAEDIVG